MSNVEATKKRMKPKRKTSKDSAKQRNSVSSTRRQSFHRQKERKDILEFIEVLKRQKDFSKKCRTSSEVRTFHKQTRTAMKRSGYKVDDHRELLKKIEKEDVHRTCNVSFLRQDGGHGTHVDSQYDQ